MRTSWPTGSYPGPYNFSTTVRSDRRRHSPGHSPTVLSWPARPSPEKGHCGCAPAGRPGRIPGRTTFRRRSDLTGVVIVLAIRRLSFPGQHAHHLKRDIADAHQLADRVVSRAVQLFDDGPI